LQEYKNLRIEALADSPQAFLDSVEEAMLLSEEEWIKRSQNMLFIEIENKLIGMGGFYADNKAKKAHVANLVSVFITKEFRGKGYGKILLQGIIEEIKKNPEYTKIEMGAITSQTNAIALYEKCGFQAVGKLTQTLKIDNTYYDEYLLEMLL
jgi:RimJ/RimL family protein N-acetyltransferase